MLDIQLLRSNTAAVAERLATRGYEFDTARFNALEEQRKAVQVKTEELQASRNSISKQIGALKGQGKHEEAQAAMDQVAQIKVDLEHISEFISSGGKPEQPQHQNHLTSYSHQRTWSNTPSGLESAVVAQSTRQGNLRSTGT